MTDLVEKVCRCGAVLVRPATGRPPRYCSTSCRRAAEYDLRRAQQLLTRAERSEQTAWMKADTWLVRRGLENPVFRAEGCPACQGNGYLGRTGVYEVVRISRKMQSLIHEGASDAALNAEARAHGPSLLQDGLRLVDAGQTTVEEIARVAQEV